LRLVDEAAAHARLQDVQLGGKQRALNAEQQPVVGIARIIRSVMLMPSLVRARCEVEVMSLARHQSLEGSPAVPGIGE